MRLSMIIEYADHDNVYRHGEAWKACVLNSTVQQKDHTFATLLLPCVCTPSALSFTTRVFVNTCWGDWVAFPC